jgi:hypothetical protein
MAKGKKPIPKKKPVKKKAKAKPKVQSAPIGRPSKFDPKYCDQVEKLCKLGATDTEIAEFFSVAESTINLWKLEHRDFSEAIKRGKFLADANVADRLYQRAIGFEHNSEEIKVVSDGQGLGSSIERVPVRKIYPPDTVAAIFWLKNRQKAKWRDKVEVDTTNLNLNSEPLSKDEIKEISKTLEDDC